MRSLVSVKWRNTSDDKKVKNEKYNYEGVSIALIPTGKWYNIIVGNDPVLNTFDSE
jgi:hypothetical protein